MILAYRDITHNTKKEKSRMFGRMMKAASATLAASQAAASPWAGVPTRLVRKTTLVEGEATPEALAAGSTTSLPVRTLTFEIPKDGNFSGRAMPHDSIRMDLGDVVKMVIPGYKPKSYSVSAMRPGEFDVTLKVYPNGRASGFLDRLEVGEYGVNSFGLSKGKSRRPPGGGGIVGLIAYGVGITEAWPIAKAELDGREGGKVVLLWAGRTRRDTFWTEEIEDYKQKYTGRLEVVHIFSREEVEGSLHGRIDPGVLSRVFKEDREGEPRFLSVGTKSMMAMTDRMLADIGFPMPQHALLA